MGDRYFLTVICPECDLTTEDVYYAPTCDFLTFKCECGHVIDLEEYSGISYDEASNAELIQQITDSYR